MALSVCGFQFPALFWTNISKLALFHLLDIHVYSALLPPLAHLILTFHFECRKVHTPALAHWIR